MELDELRLAWQTLDRRLQEQTALNLQLLTESRIDKVRSRLRPLWFWQMVQLLVGVTLTVSFANFWLANTDSPVLLASGLVMHAWSVLLIISAVMELLLITRINYAGPVLTIQKSLAQLRLWRLRTSPWLGLPFWLLWMPLTAIAFKELFGMQMHPGVYYLGIPFGVAGLLASLWLLSWARRPQQRHIGDAIDAGSAGRSVTRAQQYLDEIAQFGKE